jgi:Uma2 family endonuclease
MTAKPTVIHMTPDDLLAMPDGEGYELVNGIPVEKRMGAESGEVTIALAAFLMTHVRQHRLGHVYDGQTGFQCFPHDPGLVRKPDISFVAAGRLPGEKSPKGNVKLPPDLAIEVVSPNDLYEEVEAKVCEYRAVGVKLIWVVSPGSRTVLVRRPDGTAAVLDEAGELSGEGVIPGFTCKVADLFV